MNSAGFLELAVSLSCQAALLIGICAWLVRRSRNEVAGHRLWGSCHVMILVVTLAAVSLPHVRLVPHAWLTDHVPLDVVAPAEHWLGTATATVWAIGALLYAVGILIGLGDVHAILSTARPMMRSLDSEDHGLTILVSRRVTSPLCWQMQHPVIVLPECTSDFPLDELRGIVRHELAHLRAGHPLALFLQRLVEMVFWFHPLVWWASRQAELHREFHCDRAANRDKQETIHYLRCLLRLCEIAPEQRFGLPASLKFQGSRSLLRQRVARLTDLDHHAMPRGLSSRWDRAVLVIAGLLALGVWLPVNVTASSRSPWSPWPTWSARVLLECGFAARDYELDGHRLRPHEHVAVETASRSKVTATPGNIHDD